MTIIELLTKYDPCLLYTSANSKMSKVVDNIKSNTVEEVRKFFDELESLNRFKSYYSDNFIEPVLFDIKTSCLLVNIKCVLIVFLPSHS